MFLPFPESRRDDENMTKIIDRWSFRLVLKIINCHRMDSNQDGMITYDEFVQCVKTSGDSDLYRWMLLTNKNFSRIHWAGDVCGVRFNFLNYLRLHLLRYIEPVMSVGFTVMGFFVYSVSLYVGLSVAWFVYQSTFVYLYTWFVYQCLPSHLYAALCQAPTKQRIKCIKAR